MYNSGQDRANRLEYIPMVDLSETSLCCTKPCSPCENLCINCPEGAILGLLTMVHLARSPADQSTLALEHRISQRVSHPKAHDALAHSALLSITCGRVNQFCKICDLTLLLWTQSQGIFRVVMKTILPTTRPLTTIPNSAQSSSNSAAPLGDATPPV